MRTPIGNRTEEGLTARYVGTAYDIVTKVYDHLDAILQMGTVLEHTADFLFFRFDSQDNQSVFTGPDYNGRMMKIPALPMVYVNGIRVPQEELSVSADGMTLTMNPARMDGDQVHVAAFGFNSDGTIYFDPLLSNDVIIPIIEEIRAIRDQLLQLQQDVTAHVDAALSQMENLRDQVVGDRGEVADFLAYSQLALVNPGFEAEPAGKKGVPFGWKASWSNPAFLTNAGYVANVPADSQFGSTLSFGDEAGVSGSWFSLSKFFKIAKGDRINVNFRAWLSTVTAAPGPGSLDPDFVDINDVMLEMVSLDENGAELEITHSPTLSAKHWTDHGQAPAAETWLETEFQGLYAHEDAQFVEVRIVLLSGAGNIMGGGGRQAYMAEAMGNVAALIDDCVFYSMTGQGIIEVSEGNLDAYRNVHAAVTHSQYAAASATDAGEFATAAEQSAVAAATSQSAAEVIQQSVASSETTATQAAASAQVSRELSAVANREAANRAQGNYIGKTAFEDDLLDGWEGVVIAPVPESHPLGRTKALHQIDEYARYVPLDGWFEENIFGRVFEIKAWVFNATTDVAEMGIEVAYPGGSIFITEMVAASAMSSWEEISHEFPAMTQTSTRWRPVLRVPGSGNCYWTDTCLYDVSQKATVQGIAEAVIIDKQTVESYVTDAEEAALAAEEHKIAASTSAGQAFTHKEAAAQSATDADGSRQAAQLAQGTAAQAASTAGDHAVDAQTYRDEASSSATTAADAAASAVLSEGVSAQLVSRGALVANQFLETGWVDWVSGPNQRVQNEAYGVGKTFVFNISSTTDAGVHIYSPDHVSSVGWSGPVNPAAFTVEVEYDLISGTLGGAGVLVDWQTDTSTNRQQMKLSDMTQGPIVVGKRHFASFTAVAPVPLNGNFTYNHIYFMANYGGLGTKEQKHIKVHRISIRPATAEEQGNGAVRAAFESYAYSKASTDQAISAMATTLSADIDDVSADVSVQGAAIANLENGASAGYLIKAQAGNAVSLLEFIAADGSGGTPASIIKVKADDIMLEGSVQMKHLAVADFTNYAAGSDFEDIDSIPWQLSANVFRATGDYYTGSACLRVNPGGAANFLGAGIACQAGDKFFVEFYSKAAGGWNGTDNNSKLRFSTGPNNTGSYVAAVAYNNTSNSWVRCAAVITVPSGVTRIYPRIQSDGNTGFNLLDNIVIRRMNGGELTVDGSVKANHIGAGEVTTDKLSVGNGKNLYNDAQFAMGLALHRQVGAGGVGSQSDVAVRNAGESWAGINYPTLRIHQNGTATDGYADLWQRPDTTGADNRAIAVEPNEWYELSAYISTHRCDGEMYIRFTDANGNGVGAPYLSFPEFFGSSNNPDAWARRWIKAQAPSNAAFVQAIFRKLGTKSGSDSWMFIHKPQIAKTHAEANQPAPWSPGGQTILSGDMIKTGVVDARRVKINNVMLDTDGAGNLLIRTNGVGTNQLANNAVTAMAATDRASQSLPANASTWVNCMAVYLTMLGGRDLVVTVMGEIGIVTDGGGGPAFEWRLLVNGTQVWKSGGNASSMLKTYVGPSVAGTGVQILVQIDTNGTGGGVNLKEMSMVAIEYKR